MFSIPKGHMFLQSHELEVSTLATGVEDFGIHELRQRSPKPWFTLNSHFLVEQQSGQLSHCHIDVRSALELWLSCPDQVFIERKSPGPFCCPAFQDHSKTCFHLDAFVSMASPGLFVPCQPGMTFLLRCFSVCPLLCCCLQGSVWKVNTVHPARCPVSPEGLMLCAGGTNLVVFMKAPQIAITASEINK